MLSLLSTGGVCGVLGRGGFSPGWAGSQDRHSVSSPSSFVSSLESVSSLGDIFFAIGIPGTVFRAARVLAVVRIAWFLIRAAVQGDGVWFRWGFCFVVALLSSSPQGITVERAFPEVVVAAATTAVSLIRSGPLDQPVVVATAAGRRRVLVVWFRWEFSWGSGGQGAPGMVDDVWVE